MSYPYLFIQAVRSASDCVLYWCFFFFFLCGHWAPPSAKMPWGNSTQIWLLSCSATREATHRVCYTRYHVPFYLWLIGCVLKHCKVPKYCDQDCSIYLEFLKQYPLKHCNFVFHFARTRNERVKVTLRKKCPYSQLFWSTFSCMWTETRYSVRI